MYICNQFHVKMSRPQTLQEFEFTVRLNVTGDVLQTWDVKNILRMLCRQNLHSQHEWSCVLKGYKIKRKRDCCICYDEIKKNQLAYKTPCNHIFHKRCIQQWFDKSTTFVPTCPMCRKDCHVNYKQDNNFTVNSSYSLVDHAVEMERTIVRDGSNYIRYDNP